MNALLAILAAWIGKRFLDGGLHALLFSSRLTRLSELSVRNNGMGARGVGRLARTTRRLGTIRPTSSPSAWRWPRAGRCAGA